MFFETQLFKLSNIEWLYQTSKEISPHPKGPVKVGVKSLTATCKSCNFSWQAAQYGEGKLMHILGGFVVSCPSCKIEESIKGSDLK
jgi:hypothetical protein